MGHLRCHTALYYKRRTLFWFKQRRARQMDYYELLKAKFQSGSGKWSSDSESPTNTDVESKKDSPEKAEDEKWEEYK